MRAGSSRNLLDRLGLRLIVAVAASMVALGGLDTAQAFDFFGLWGSDEAPTAVSPTAIAYAVTIDIAGGDGGLKTAVQDSSSLYRLRNDPPPDGEALARRAQSDFAPIIDALCGRRLGYCNSTVAMPGSIGGARPEASPPGDIATLSPAPRNPPANGTPPPPSRSRSDPGPMFKLSAIRVVGPGGVEFTDAELPPRIVILKPGDPAVAAGGLRAATNAGYRLFPQPEPPASPRGSSIAPVVDHAKLTMDVTFTVDPGPIAPFGVEATMTGPQNFNPAIARSFLYIQPGDPYSPRALADARSSIRGDSGGRGRADHQIESSRTAMAACAYTWSTSRTARNMRSARRQNIRPPTARQARSMPRTTSNVFRGARAAAPASRTSSTHRHGMSPRRASATSRSTISGWRFSASFLQARPVGHAQRPFDRRALDDERVSTSGAGFLGYEVEDADVTAQIRHRFTQTFWFQMERRKPRPASPEDALGRVNYTLVGVPASVNYDTTDSKLDPTQGVRINASVAGFPTALGSEPRPRRGKSARVRLLPDRRRWPLRAGRPDRARRDGRRGAGGHPGQLALLRRRRRIRARIRFQQPRADRTLWRGDRRAEACSKRRRTLRVRITDTIGIVPFIDAGNAFSSKRSRISARRSITPPELGCAIIRRSGRSAQTSPFRSITGTAPGRSRSMSASGRPSDGAPSSSPSASRPSLRSLRRWCSSARRGAPPKRTRACSRT